MKYIWINPVTGSMYDAAVLNAFLKQHGYQHIEASAHWLDFVKENYKTAVKTAKSTVIDMRCPKTLTLLQGTPLSEAVTIPAIEPILIHCGRELSGRKDLQGTEKIITTPCQALADMGNTLQLPETRFIPWNQFLSSLGGGLTASPLEESPIPPGFFSELDCRTHSLTGEEEIKACFSTASLPETDLLEILFCKNGCHNGDGVRMCDAP